MLSRAYHSINGFDGLTPWFAKLQMRPYIVYHFWR